MDLVTFVEKLINSDSPDDQQLGARMLDRFLRKEEYKSRVLLRIRASPQTVGTLIHLLGLKNPEAEDTRGHAARVVVEIASDLLVESFPAMMQTVASLLVANEKSIKERSGHQTNSASIEFIWLGVQILERLAHDLCNCRQIGCAEDLLPKIVELTNYDDSMTSNEKDMVEMSLKVVHKLVSTTGETGKTLRCRILDNVHILRNINNILEHPETMPKLARPGIEILSSLALEEIAREEIGSSRGIIKKLVSLLMAPSEIIGENSIRKVAAEALVMLSMESSRTCGFILMETKLENMQQLVMMLSIEYKEYRIVVAKLLQNLLPCLGILEYPDHLKQVTSALPNVLEAIKVELEESSEDQLVVVLEGRRSEVGKVLESFIGLSVQICKLLHKEDFADALKIAKVTTDEFVRKLKKILDVYKYPTTDFPGIRRAIVELLIWLMQSNKNYVNLFMQYKINKALEEVEETASKLENFKIFSGGVGVIKHGEPLSCLAKKAQQLIAGNLNERA